MDGPPPVSETREGQMLERLAGLGLELAISLQQRADERQDAPFREKARQARVSRRHTQGHHAVQRLIWTEHEHEEDEADSLIDGGSLPPLSPAFGLGDISPASGGRPEPPFQSSA